MSRAIRFLPALAALALAACQELPSEPGTDVPVPEPSAAQTAARQAPPFVPGEVLIRPRAEADLGALARDNGVSVATRGYEERFVVVRGAPGNEVATAARLRADARVVWAEPNWLRQPTGVDPRLWAFVNPGDLSVSFNRGRQKGDPVTSYLSLADADEDNVEGYGSGGAPVVVGSIDTGVDFGHPEFAPGQLVAGRDWYDGDADPSDTEGHGTHTTGTMVGATVGVAGVSGAGSNVRVLVQRVCGSLGCPTSAIVSAIYAAADHPGMVAMNLSLGGGSLSQAEADAIDYAVNGRGVLVIASAGNDGTGAVSCPACDPNALSVAATNWQDELSYYSNWGPGLDLAAPGGELYSNTTSESGIYSSVPGGYAYYQGTSMSAPQVTGAAGVVASVTGLTGASLRARLEGTADDLGPSGYDQTFGNGRLNSYRAVTGSTLDESGQSGGDPDPTLTASFGYGCDGADCAFDASASSGADSYAWSFGDGSSGAGATVSHTFPGDGDYTVVLTVEGSGTTDAASSVVSCKTRGKNGLACR